MVDFQMHCLDCQRVPSGNDKHSYWKWQFIVSFPSKNDDFPGFSEAIVMLVITRGYQMPLILMQKNPPQRHDQGHLHSPTQ